jgi:hypothetical protein
MTRTLTLVYVSWNLPAYLAIFIKYVFQAHGGKHGSRMNNRMLLASQERLNVIEK